MPRRGRIWIGAGAAFTLGALAWWIAGDRLIERFGSAEIPWETSRPAEVGFDSAKLEALRAGLASRATGDLLIARRGQIVFEWYGPGRGPERRHYTASLQKSLAGGMALLVALSDGRMRLDDRASRYIPAWRDEPLRSRITIRQLAAHCSGIEDAEQAGVPHAELVGWKGAFWAGQRNPFSLVLTEAPVLFEPGTRSAYSSAGFAPLGYAITASLRGAPEEDIRTLLRERIMGPIGVPPGAWSMGYGAEYRLDGLRLHPIWGGGTATARAVARVGQLMLQRGRWEGQALLDPAWVEAATTHAGTPIPERSPGDPVPVPTAGWFANSDGVWPAVPRDAFVGAGAGNQILLVVPSLELVVVRFGSLLGDPQRGESYWGGVKTHLLDPLMDALAAPGHSRSSDG